MQLTANALKEIAKLNPAAHAKIMEHKTHCRLRKIGFSAKPAGFQRYLAEGERISFFTPEGKTVAANMVTESTLGCQPSSFNYAVGQYTPPLPEGTWIVSSELFLGKWVLTVEYVGPLQLPQ